MLSDKQFIYGFGAATLFTFLWMFLASEPLAYIGQLIPHILVLIYWFQNDGWKYKFLSFAWIGYTLVDISSILTQSLSSLENSIIALFSILMLIIGFFFWRDGYARRRAYLAFIAVAYGAGYFFLVQEAIPGDIFVPIAIYAVMDAVIFVVIAGMQLKNAYSYIMCLFGVFIYVTADGLYAYHYFVESLDLGEPIMSTLHALSQGMFIVGIVNENKV